MPIIIPDYTSYVGNSLTKLSIKAPYSLQSDIDSSIESRITIVSAQCIFGINILKDMFSFVRDIIGGRVNSLETGLEEATNKVLNELKEKAYVLGGNAVIGIKIEHTYNNANSGSILSVFATGTVVKLKN